MLYANLEGMDTEIQALQQELQAIREIVEQDHQMIHAIHRRVRMASIFNAIKWTLLIGFSLGTFYYIQPFLDVILKTYTGAGGIGTGLDSGSSIDLLRTMISQ